MVKLMKAKRSIQYSEVGFYNEVVILQFKETIMEDMKKWNITESDFKACLEGLIENEYIERDDTMLSYV